MTEVEWQSSSELMPMIKEVVDHLENRKLRLFAVACCRRAWEHLDERNRNAVEVAERLADGKATQKERQTAYAARRVVDARSLLDTGIMCAHRLTRIAATQAPESSALLAAAAETGFANPSAFGAARRRTVQERCDLLRDIVGSPFARPRRVTAGLKRAKGKLRSLAQTIYDERAFDRLPILADALEDAGCHDADILAHCRSGRDHVRGCWVVDLLLGKS
jgi:hypothetical protein